MVHAHEGPVQPEILGGHRELDGLHERVARSPRDRAGNGLPVAE